ncbi:MAG: hypothetical protein QNK92_15805 [Amylibacter sp.]
MAIMKDARERNPWIFHALINSAHHYTDLMGLKNVIGIVENLKLMRFWRICGSKETGEAPLELDGHTYRPIRLTIHRDEPQEELTPRQAIMAVPEVFDETRRNA